MVYFIQLVSKVVLTEQSETQRNQLKYALVLIRPKQFPQNSITVYTYMLLLISKGRTIFSENDVAVCLQRQPHSELCSRCIYVSSSTGDLCKNSTFCHKSMTFGTLPEFAVLKIFKYRAIAKCHVSTVAAILTLTLSKAFFHQYLH